MKMRYEQAVLFLIWFFGGFISVIAGNLCGTILMSAAMISTVIDKSGYYKKGDD